jgi:hypothetical protein
LQRKGLDAPQSRKLLAVMRETMALQISHVKLRSAKCEPIRALNRRSRLA